MNALQMRVDVLKMALAAKSNGAHLGGSLSLIEIMAALYGGVMNFNAADPSNEKRDRLIFSKGHGVMAQYVAYKQMGLLSEEELLTYKADNTVVSAHPSMNAKLGIEFSSGSLGQGLSLGVGVALALRRKCNQTSRVFVILGDGECDEGSIWEAAASASHYELDNLVVIVDKNGLQHDGETKNILSMENLGEKWKAFGWHVEQVDGHDEALLSKTLQTRSGQPFAVIADTVKGKGISFMENAAQWHNGVVTQRIFEQAMQELGGTV